MVVLLRESFQATRTRRHGARKDDQGATISHTDPHVKSALGPSAPVSPDAQEREAAATTLWLGGGGLYLISSSSMSNFKADFGGIDGGLPASPYALS